VSTSPDPHGSPPVLDPRAQRRVLLAMLTALVAVIASMSGLNVAQQDLALDLGASQGTVLWIINAYTLALAGLLMPIGAVGDRWGRKPVLQAGLVLFGLSGALAAFAPSAAVVIIARIGAGAGAAMIMPVTLSVITSTFPPEERARAIGLWAGVAGSGGMLGLYVSAFMVDVLTWRWTFLLPIVLVAVSAVATTLFVPNTRHGGTHPFDIVGSILSALAIGGLVLGIHEGPEKGWGHPLCIAGLVVGGVALIGFVVWERRHPEPLLDISTFADRGLATGTATLLIVFAVLFGIFIVLFPFFQAVIGWSALRSAAALLPMAVAMMPMSTVAPQIAQRIGSRTTMLIGLALVGTGLVVLALQASVAGGYLSVLPGLVIMGLGMGITMTPATAAITETLPPEKQGVASALNDTSREIGSAVGVALLGSILSSGYRAAVEPALAGLPPELAEAAGEGIGAAFAVARNAGEQAPVIIAAAKEAFVAGWVRSIWIGVALAVVAFVFVAVRGPARAAAGPAGAEPEPLVAD